MLVAVEESEEAGLRPKIVDALLSRRVTGAALLLFLVAAVGRPAAADDLVLRLRGKPWDVDDGEMPALLPVALEDRPREHRQDVHRLATVGRERVHR